MATTKSAAQIAYEAYRSHTGGTSLATGQPIPEWDALRWDIQRAWGAAAQAVTDRECSVLARALEVARHGLVSTHGLIAHDGHPEHTFTIDNAKDLAAIDAALNTPGIVVIHSQYERDAAVVAAARAAVAAWRKYMDSGEAATVEVFGAYINAIAKLGKAVDEAGDASV